LDRESWPATIFIDLDGTIVQHQVPPYKPSVLIPGVIEKLLQWRQEGHRIVLTTARPFLEAEEALVLLRNFGFAFDECVFSITPGKRYIINDRKYDDEDKAIGINLQRDKGLLDVDISR
jgi:hypothetical protein